MSAVDPTDEERRKLEQQIMDSICKSVAADIDRLMLTPCVICNEIGFAHIDGPPEGCTGFVAPEGSA